MNIAKASDRVILTPLVDGTGVLLDLDSKCYFTLNSTGVRIWQTMSASEEVTVDAITAMLVEEFDVSADSAREDTELLLAELAQESLATVSG
ncbi:MAG: hypothetical protein ACJAYU_003251 [Bradymonadia bacterium]|jgi:hypothetical protein